MVLTNDDLCRQGVIPPVGCSLKQGLWGRKLALQSSLVRSIFLLPFQPFPSNTLILVVGGYFIAEVLTSHFYVNAGGVEYVYLFDPLRIERFWGKGILCGNRA